MAASLTNLTIDDLMGELRSSRYRTSKKLDEKSYGAYFALYNTFQNSQNGLSESDCEFFAERFSKPLSKILDKYPTSNGLEEKLAEHVHAEIGLLSEAGFTKNQIYHAIRKLSVYEADELRKYSKTIVSAALKSKNPLEAAERFKKNHDNIKQLAESEGCQIAGTIASMTFRLKNPLATAQLYIENYKNIKRYLVTAGVAETKAKRVAAKVFKKKKPFEEIKKYFNENEIAAIDVMNNAILDYAKRKIDAHNAEISRIRKELDSQRLQTDLELIKIRLRVSELDNYTNNIILKNRGEENLTIMKKLLNASSQMTEDLKDLKSKFNLFLRTPSLQTA